MIARKIQIFGKVQGVFFRASAKTEADNLKINGWVVNESDGTVLIEAQGTEENIKKLIEWCKKGPQFAKVSSVSVEECVTAEHVGFEVRH